MGLFSPKHDYKHLFCTLNLQLGLIGLNHEETKLVEGWQCIWCEDYWALRKVGAVRRRQARRSSWSFAFSCNTFICWYRQTMTHKTCGQDSTWAPRQARAYVQFRTGSSITLNFSIGLIFELPTVFMVYVVTSGGGRSNTTDYNSLDYVATLNSNVFASSEQPSHTYAAYHSSFVSLVLLFFATHVNENNTCRNHRSLF